MRNIKFRAWSVHENKMISCFEPIMYNKVIPLCNKTSEFKASGEDSRHYYLMQFTGLQDKNGVDIYEGDIIKHQAVGICLVVESFAAFMIETVENKNVYYEKRLRHFDNYKPKSFTVKGNIHKNPELLGE